MEEKWLFIVKIVLCLFMETHGDEEATYVGATPVDPIKEMLRRFDESPWTVFAIEKTTNVWEKEMKDYLENHEQMEDIEKEMKIHGIIPDVIDDNPNQVLDMKYRDENNFTSQVHLGEIYPPAMCLREPIVKYKTKPNTSYVHVMIDPDHICSRYEPEIDSSEEDLIPTTTDDGVLKTFVHHLRVNVPHDNSTTGGEDIVEYLAPHPPNGTGLHRYIYLVYEQPHQFINITDKRIEATTAYERDWFKISHFEKKYKLVLPPVAGTFFYARFDKAVPYIYAGLHDVLI